jgi:hypothetical protein
MYSWIWRHLPFNRNGKIALSAVIVLAIVALLWYKVFPWVEPILPFDDGQLDGVPVQQFETPPVETGEPSPSSS